MPNSIETEHQGPSPLIVPAWFALVTGLCEGFGLLAFQRINSANWGRIMLVSTPVLWIAPIFDFLIFVLVALGVMAASRFLPRIPVHKTLVFVFTSLMVYIWLALTQRLTYHADLIVGIGVGVAATRWFVKHRERTFRVWRTTLPWLIVGVILTFAFVEGRDVWHERSALAKLPAATASSPNVLVIVVDTLRSDHMSAYGYARETTPHLDQFARQGVLFQNAITTSSWTLPSHASMLTGRYTYEHGADRVKLMSVIGPSADTLDNRYPMLGEAFERHGYRTAAFTANRIFFNHYLGFARGFTRFDDFAATDMFARTVLGQRLAFLVVYHDLFRKVMVRIGFRSLDRMQVVGDGGLRRRGPEITHSVLGWIDHDRSRPFFAFLNYFDVHPPFRGAHSLGQKFSHGDRTLVNDYDDGVADVDEYVADLLHELDRRGLTENTFIIFTSDHGELLNEHGLLSHQNALYRQLIQVPLVISKPGTIPAGLRINTPVTLSAVPATVMDLLGWSDQALFPGPSLAELWTHPGPHPDWPNSLSELAQFVNTEKEWPSHSGSLQSMVTPKWHYIYHQKFGPELYDWQADRPELNNLARKPDDEPVVKDLAGKLKDLTAKPREIGRDAVRAEDTH